MISANADLVMESKARWDAGGKELYGQKVVGTPFEFVERKVGSHVLYKRVEKHWRQTPAYKELEFRWVPEGVTRLATLMAGEVHIADIDRALQRDAVSKGMQVVEQIAGHAAPVALWRDLLCYTGQAGPQNPLCQT